MPIGNGANWTGGGTAYAIVYFEVGFDAGRPSTGVVRLEILPTDNAATVAENLADTWKQQPPLPGTWAEVTDGLVAFFHRDGYAVTHMAVTPVGAGRTVLAVGTQIEVLTGLYVANKYTRISG